MILIVIQIFIIIVQATESEKCFKLNEETIEINGGQLTVNGTGRMCNCQSNEFIEKNSITSIVIGEHVKSIGAMCFANFEEVEEITIGDSIEVIGKGSFTKTKITQLTIPKNVKKIESRAFENCEELTEVTFTDDSELEEIEEYAFRNCVKLKSFEIPKKLKMFNKKIFEGCETLETLSIDPEHEKYTIENDMLMTKDKNEVIYQLPQGMTGTHLSFSEEIEIVDEKVFIGSEIETVSFPQSLERIENRTFYFNKQLKSLYLPSNVNEIGTLSFAGNENLERVVITSQNISIGRYAFLGCEKLKEIIFVGEVMLADEGIFERTSIDKIKVPEEFDEDESEIDGIEIDTTSLIVGTCGTSCWYIYDKETKRMFIYGNGMIEQFDRIEEIKQCEMIIIEEGIQSFRNNQNQYFE